VCARMSIEMFSLKRRSSVHRTRLKAVHHPSTSPGEKSRYERRSKWNPLPGEEARSTVSPDEIRGEQRLLHLLGGQTAPATQTPPEGKESSATGYSEETEKKKKKLSLLICDLVILWEVAARSWKARSVDDDWSSEEKSAGRERGGGRSVYGRWPQEVEKLAMRKAGGDPEATKGDAGGKKEARLSFPRGVRV